MNLFGSVVWFLYFNIDVCTYRQGGDLFLVCLKLQKWRHTVRHVLQAAGRLFVLPCRPYLFHRTVTFYDFSCPGLDFEVDFLLFHTQVTPWACQLLQTWGSVSGG